MNTKLEELIKVWQGYVSLNYYKDRDVVFSIEKRYGWNAVSYNVFHYAYVGEKNLEVYGIKTHEEALKIMIEYIEELLMEQKDWAEDLSKNRSQYDSEQIAQAEYLLNYLNNKKYEKD